MKIIEEINNLIEHNGILDVSITKLQNQREELNNQISTKINSFKANSTIIQNFLTKYDNEKVSKIKSQVVSKEEQLNIIKKDRRVNNSVYKFILMKRLTTTQTFTKDILYYVYHNDYYDNYVVNDNGKLVIVCGLANFERL
jgi:hypothetical protein